MNTPHLCTFCMYSDTCKSKADFVESCTRFKRRLITIEKPKTKSCLKCSFYVECRDQDFDMDVEGCDNYECNGCGAHEFPCDCGEYDICLECKKFSMKNCYGGTGADKCHEFDRKPKAKYTSEVAKDMANLQGLTEEETNLIRDNCQHQGKCSIDKWCKTPGDCGDYSCRRCGKSPAKYCICHTDEIEKHVCQHAFKGTCDWFKTYGSCGSCNAETEEPSLCLDYQERTDIPKNKCHFDGTCNERTCSTYLTCTDYECQDCKKRGIDNCTCGSYRKYRTEPKNKETPVTTETDANKVMDMLGDLGTFLKTAAEEGAKDGASFTAVDKAKQIVKKKLGKSYPAFLQKTAFGAIIDDILIPSGLFVVANLFPNLPHATMIGSVGFRAARVAFSDHTRSALKHLMPMFDEIGKAISEEMDGETPKKKK